LRDARGADDGPVRVCKWDFVGDVPNRQSLGLANQFNAVHDPFPGEYIFVIQAILVGQEDGRQVVIGLAENAFRAGVCLASRPSHGIVNQKRPIDPAIAAIAVLDPYQGVLDAIEKRG
jgi:hypothetical protein